MPPLGFTTVPDKNVGDVFTEAMWDTFIRDNLNYLYANLNDELAYKAAPQGNPSITATTEAAANVVVTADPITLDGATSIWVEFFIPRTSGGDATFWLYDGSTSLGKLGFIAGNGPGTTTGRRRLTNPSAGAHTYSVRVSRSGSATSYNSGDPNQPGGFGPAYIRVVRAP